MDGFSSHVNVAEALQQFRHGKHHAFKEEGGSSHINQSYDRDVTKKDKASTKVLLDLLEETPPNERQGLVDTIDSFYHDVVVIKKDEILIHEGQREDTVDDEMDERVNEEAQKINVEGEKGRFKQSNLDVFTLKPPSLPSDKPREGREHFFGHVCQFA
eukprot:2713045-Ditylum_brightwellii.AAC.1